MAFDPDEYLNETGTSSTATAEFDPDAYLSETEEQEAPFDPDAYLAEVETPAQPAPPVGTSFFEEVAAIPQALRQAIDQPTEAMAETATVLGMPALGETLRGAVEGAEGYVPAAQRFMEPQEGEFQIGGFAPQFLPRAIVEQAGQIAGAIATRAAGRAIGGLAGLPLGPAGKVAGQVAGQFIGPALFEMSQIVGPAAKERAANQGREEPNTDDLAWAWGTAGASGALNAIGAKYLPNGDKLVGGLASRIATAVAGEGTTEGLQSVVQQTGQTFLTEQGLEIKPKEAIGEALIGGGAGGAAVVAAAPFTPTPEAKAAAAADTKVAAEQAAPVAPETAQVVSEQANQVIAQAQAEETAETPDERVARLQREAQEAAGEIELEEEPPVSGLPPVELTPPATPTPEAAVAPVEPVVPAEGVAQPPTPEAAPTRNLADLEVRPPTDNVQQVAAANDLTVGRADVNVPAQELESTVNLSDPKERERVDSLKEQISSEGGFISRVIVDGQNNVVEGQHRVQAMKELGYDQIPAVQLKSAEDFIPDSNALDKVMQDAGLTASDNRTQMRQLIAEIISDEKGDVTQLREYEAPAGFETAWNAATEEVIRQNAAPEAAPAAVEPTQVTPPPVTPEFAARPKVTPEERIAKLDRLKEVKAEIEKIQFKPVEGAEVGLSGLTTEEAKRYSALMMEAEGIRFDLRKELKVEKIESEKERKSTIPPDIIKTASDELASDRGVWSAITEAAVGTFNNMDTAVDIVMDGKNPDVSPSQLYNAFNNTREALRQKFGDTITLYRAVGKQKPKATTNWLSTKEAAMDYGKNVVEKEIPIDDIVALNVGLFGRYEEFIVGKKPAAEVAPTVSPQLEPLRRVARAEQTEEDVAGLVDAGFVEVYNGQPVITQAGIEALPEAERPRLTPEARKIQIDTRTSEAAAEAISKNLRIGVDQVPVDVRMPAGWTLVGDVYVPPQPTARITPSDIETAVVPEEAGDVFANLVRRKQEVQPAVLQKPVGSQFQNPEEFRAAFDLRGQGHTRFAIRLDLMQEDGAITEDGKNLILATIWDNNTNDEFLSNIEMGSARKNVKSYGYGGRSRQTVEGGRVEQKPLLELIRATRRGGTEADKRTALTLNTFWHEFGHAGYYSLLDAKQKKAINDAYSKTTRAGRRAFFAEGKSDIENTPWFSKYYAKNESEWFAQSFAEYVITQKSDQKKLVPVFEQLLDKIKAVFTKLFNRKEQVNLNDIFDFILRGEAYGQKPTWQGYTMSTKPAVYGTPRGQAISPEFTKRLLAREQPTTFADERRQQIIDGISLRFKRSKNEYGNNEFKTEYDFGGRSEIVDKISFSLEQFDDSTVSIDYLASKGGKYVNIKLGELEQEFRGRAAAERAIKRAIAEIEMDERVGGAEIAPTPEVREARRELAITPQQDRDYLDAVERGDLDAASRLVEDVAKAAGFTIGPVQHRTAETFTVFDLSAKPVNRAGNPSGFYFTKDAGAYRGTRTVSAFLSINNPFNLKGGNEINQAALDQYRKELLSENKHLDESDSWFDGQVDKFKSSGRMPYTGMSGEAQRRVLIAGGYDGIVDGSDFAAFYPNQIKSSEPVTRDDQGNIIPLSQRFQPEQADIRYGKRTPSPIENIFDAREGIGQVPFNIEVGYRGFVKYMTPSEFRSLVPAGVSGPETKQFVVEALGRGEKLGQPFLNVEWNEADGVWEVTDHEGRSRVDAILEVYGNVPIPVHLFPRGLRAADITEQMRDASFISQADLKNWKRKETKQDVNPVAIETQQEIRALRMPSTFRDGMETSAVEARLQELGFPAGGIIRVVNEPDADFEGRTIILDGKVTGIELNAAAMRDNATIDRVLNHEFAESANADGALNRLVERLTPKEKKEINDTITRLRYEERARTSEEAARAIETLAEAWKGRGFFTRAVARVEAWASKLGFKLTRRAAEYIAARNLADINSGFRTAYNQTINRVLGDEARYSYAGMLAVTPRFMRDSLKAAQSMAAAGKTNEEIRLATGWFKGKYDNKLRWEIPDYKSFIKKDATKKLKEGGDVRLEDVLDHPELYAAYPDAKRIKVYLMTKDEGASYAANTIGINPFSKFEGFNFRNAMLHEIQHWIQDKEGFASGTSPERFAHSMSRLKEDLKEAEEGLRDIKREWYDSDEQYQKERESWAWEVDLYKKIIRAKERGLGAYQIYQLAAGEIEANDVERRNSMDEEARKRYEPYAFSNVSPEDAIAMDVRGAMPTSMEVRESRREPEAIPTFTEGTPEAATLKEMEASMAKVDAASEAKGGKPETYKISEIASVWMDSGLGERELQDAIVEYTNLTPANAAKVARAIARQYDIQQSIASAFLETPTGLSVEAIPEGATLPPEVDPDRPKPVMVRLFETYMGVKVPPTKLTVNEKTALRDQIRLKAAANREAKKAQQATQSEVIDIIKAMELRGPVRPKQAAALAKRAAKVIWTSEKSMEAFVNYAEKVVINTNYDADLREAKAAQKRAQQLSKSEKVAAPQREVLADIAKIGVNMLDNPAEFAVAVNHYLRGFKSVVSPDYVVIPDAEITSYLSAMQAEADANKAEFDRATNERLAIKYGIPLNELEKYLNAENIIRDLASYARREVVEGILTEKAQETLAGLKAYDQTQLRDEQRKILDEMVKVDPRNLDSEERQRFVRIGNNIIFNNQTNGAEYFVATAKGQQMAREMAKDETAIAKNKAWVNLLPSIVSPKLQRGWALELQSVADTFRNAFGKGAMGKVYRMMGMLDLNMAQTKANTQLDQIQEEISAFYNGLEKKYKAAARNQDGILAEGVVGFLIQKVPEKGETESLAQRRNLIRQDIRNRREDGDQDRVEMANRIEALLQQLDGATVQDILNNLKQNYRPNYDSLMFLKDTLFPKYKEFLKRFDENFNDQANNYENPDYLPIGFVRAGPSLAITEEETGQFYDHVSLRPKQSSYTIKRADYTQLPTDQSTGTPKEIEFNLRRNAFDSLSDQITKAYTNPAWQRINAFLKTPESIEVFGGRANRDFFIERLNRLRLSRMRRGALSRGYIEKTADVVSVIARKLGTGIALGGVYQTFKQAPDQLITTLATTGRRDLLGKNAMDVLAQQLAPKTLRESTKMLNKFSIGRRGDASAGYKYINQMEGAQTRMERYFTESKWDQAKEQGSKIADIWMVALKKSDFVAAAGSWLTYYRADLAKRGIKFEGWEREAELVDTDPARQDAAAYAEQMTDIYQGSSDPTQMATFAQSGKSGWENLWKSMFVPFNSFAVQQRMRLYSDARDALTKTGVDQKTGYLGLSGTIGGMILFHMVKRLFIPTLSGLGVGVLYGVMGVDVEEPDEEKKKEDLNKRWRQMQGEILANMLVGGTGQIIEAKTIDAFNYAAYLISVQTENESVLDDNGEVMPFSTYVKERSPFWRYQAFDSAYSLGMLEIGLGQAQKAITQSKMLMDSEEMENFTPEEQRLLYFAAVSEWLYTMRLNDADFARLVDKARRDMIKAVKDREKELQRIRSGR